MLKSLIPNEVKVKSTIDDIRLNSKLTTNKTKNLARKHFLYTKWSFTQSHLGLLNDPLQRFKRIPRTYERGNPLTFPEVTKFL